jgi:hypothetical protein
LHCYLVYCFDLILCRHYLAWCCTQKIFGVFCLTFSRACAIYKRYKEKGADGDSKHRAKAKANRGEWKPGASKNG